jgi:2-amino-4-hydroxy-6-hydroxymethyldihydropteridine diphosphokinase
MVTAFIGIGSNIGDRINHCRKSIEFLSEKVKIVKQSSFYKTKPWGKPDQEPFINLVVEIETELAPRGLLEFLKEIESKLGRTMTVRWGPRIIDLDILSYDNRIIKEDDLIIPHQYLHERLFVLAPLSEIAPPDLYHPILKKGMSEILSSLKGLQNLQETCSRIS